MTWEALDPCYLPQPVPAWPVPVKTGSRCRYRLRRDDVEFEIFTEGLIMSILIRTVYCWILRRFSRFQL